MQAMFAVLMVDAGPRHSAIIRVELSMDSVASCPARIDTEHARANFSAKGSDIGKRPFITLIHAATQGSKKQPPNLEQGVLDIEVSATSTTGTNP